MATLPYDTNALIAQTKAMLEQTKAQGATSFAGSSYDTGFKGAVPMGNTPPVTPPVITPQSLAPAKPIVVPPAPVPGAIDTGGVNAFIAGTSGALTGGTTPTDTSTNPFDDLFKSYLGAQPKPTSGADTLSTLEQTAGLTGLQQDSAKAKAARLAAEGRLAGINTQLDQLKAQQALIPEQIQLQAQGQGVTAGGMAPLQAAELRKNALQQLPLQISAMTAQRDVALAQGNEQLANDILNQAQTHIDKVFQVQMQDAQNHYNYQKDLLDKVWDFASGKEQARLNELSKKADRDFALLQGDISNAKDLAKLALQNGQPDLAAKFSALDPNSPTFKKDLANLQGEFAVKASEASAPVVKSINGVDAQWNPQTGQWEAIQLTNAKTSQPLSDTQSSEVLDNKSLIDTILSRPDLISMSYGLGRFKPETFIPGHPVYETQAKIDQLVATLSLDNRKKLKGSGQISDFESRTLESASTILGKKNISADAAQKELRKVRGAFTTAAGLRALVQVTNPKTGETAYVNATRDGIDSALRDGMKVEYW